MRAEEIKGLMEAYSHVYETPEVLSEGPYDAKNVIATQRSQEGRDALRNVGGYAGLSRAAAAAGDTAGAKRYMQKSQEIGDKRKAETDAKTAADKKTADERRSEDTEAFKRAMNPGASPGSTPTTGAGKNTGGSGVSTIPSSTKNSPYTAKNLGDAQYKAYKAGGGDAAMAKGMGTAAQIIARGRKASASAGSGTPANPVTRPATTSAAPKPATTSATSKPTTPVAPAKPAGSAMDQWAKANPKLAAAKAERDRTRGTSATTNPLMKDMKSSLPAPKSPSPSTASTAFGLAKKGVNLAAGVDIFDLVKGHLLDEGYADSEEGAMVIMVNMSEEWRKSILESYGVELDEAASSRREGESESEFVMRRRTEYMRPRRGPEHETERTSYSPTRARAGEDIGKPGKMFGKIAKEAGKRYDSEEKGKKVAGAVLAKLRKEDLELDESSKTDDGTRERIRMYAGKKGISFEPGPRWDPSANRGKGANLSDKQIEKQRRKALRKEDLEAWVDQLIAEGYDLSEYTWEEVAEIYAEELQLMELTGGKGHPGYKAGSKDHGDLEDHPAVKKGGVLTPRHGEHLGDLDDEDDEDDELENIIRDRSRARRENVRKPLRDKVKAARKKMTKEEMELDEAQRARENPEDHDKEEKRKYEPVRGERTPMPPRGDKRREEFEKWYAKQMGR